MSVEAIGFTFDFVGTVLLAVSLFRVHSRVMHEHKIDRKVIREIRKEQIMIIIGLALIVIGYVLQIQGKL